MPGGPQFTCMTGAEPSKYLCRICQGEVCSQKSKRSFSAIVIDQTHEHNNNAIVKGDGGAIGLTENSAALHRWMHGLRP